MLSEPVSEDRDRDTDAHELLLLTTEQLVQAYDLKRVSRIRVGRHRSNELRLSSRMVSNFHAEIVFEDGLLVLRDLGSTNGTRLNGVPVDRATLSTGDRIVIGNHVIRLELKARADFVRSAGALVPPDHFRPGARGRLICSYTAGPEALKTLRSKDFHEICLIDLLTGLLADPGAAKVIVEHEEARASIYVHRGQVLHVEQGSAVGEKALYRAMRWQESTYTIEPLPDPGSVACSIALPFETLVSEGVDQALELGKLVARLPPLAAQLRLNEECPLPLTAHSPAEIEIFLEIIRRETIEAVLDGSPFTDVRVLRLVESLLSKGVFAVVTTGNTDSRMEETQHANLDLGS